MIGKVSSRTQNRKKHISYSIQGRFKRHQGFFNAPLKNSDNVLNCMHTMNDYETDDNKDSYTRSSREAKNCQKKTLRFMLYMKKTKPFLYICIVYSHTTPSFCQCSQNHFYSITNLPEI